MQTLIDTFIRDVTSVVPMPKSEVRARLEEIIKARDEEVKGKVEELRFDTDYQSINYWNKGKYTDQRTKDVINRKGSIVEQYNQTLDDILSTL